MEKGERVVTADELVALAVAFGVSPSALLLPLDDSHSRTTLITGAGEVPLDVAWDWADGKRTLRAPADSDTANLEFMLNGRPPGRRRPRRYLKGERTADQLAALRQYFERLAAHGDVDLEVIKRLDPELWEVET
jgi:hypothetical protein